MEALTGIVSCDTGQLSIPPSMGVGTVVDLAILLTGIAVAVLRAVKRSAPMAGEMETSRSQ